MPSYDPPAHLDFDMNHSQSNYPAMATMMTPKKGLCVVNVQPDKQTKNRRKRTQAGDKAILESAYQANAKPDKAARLAIVRQVSMTEKEVQIWFQNRRQNDRRKSRPLSAQEIAALRYGGMQVISSESASPEIRNALQAACGGVADPVSRTQSHYANPRALDSPPIKVLPSHTPVHISVSQIGANASASPIPSLVDSSPLVRTGVQSSASAMHYADMNSSPENEIRTPCHNTSNGQYPVMIKIPDSVSNCRVYWNNMGMSSPSSPVMGSESKPQTPSGAPQNAPSRRLPEPLSKVRLGYSLDGRAEITSEPSPTHFSASDRENDVLPEIYSKTPEESIGRTTPVTLPPLSALTRGIPTGRSRDVHEWEVCCDRNTPQDDQLTKIALNEAAGSALAEISLRRSTNNLSGSYQSTHGHPGALQINNARKNTVLSPTPQLANGKASRVKKPLYRSNLNYRDDPFHTPLQTSKVQMAMLVSDASPTPGSADSDKENWTPEDSQPGFIRHLMSQDAIQARPQSRHRRSHSPASEASSVLSKKRPRADTDDAYENAESASAPRKRTARDDDVNRFARAASPSKRGDEVCVAGLLALSQGNWR
ncbi:hypothetical protein BROUX41_000612 [Berkeleyomyces rouxiae]|uniref:uncharacterized protein n=1 Tax=Berkeleyomyces rouxiae TaxID=2035830 RepID=UPI003B81EC24